MPEKKESITYYICYKCLSVNTYNPVKRKYKGKYLDSETHQCKKCGSYTFMTHKMEKN